MCRSSISCLLGTLAVICVVTASGCGSDSASTEAPAASISPDAGQHSTETAGTAAAAEGHTTVTDAVTVQRSDGAVPNPVVVLKTTLGDVKIELNAVKAPITVENFLQNYADRGFYDGTIFHYVDKGFMVAAGGYTPDRTAKPTRGEILNEADNGLKNVRGAVAMARHPDYENSATSQFFINLVDNSFLDHAGTESAAEYGYCVFGKVVAGMDVIDRLAEVTVEDTEEFPRMPVDAVVINSVERVQ